MAMQLQSREVGRGNHRASPRRAEAEPLESLIAGLTGLDADQLRLQWRNHLGGAVPAYLPAWLLLRVLAYRIQAAALGDLDKATQRHLRRPKEGGAGSDDALLFAARMPTTREGVGLRPGSMLLREWDGRPQRVMILEEGGYVWNGKTYRSLSQVAKAITGTNWNGHRFFGLKWARRAGDKRTTGKDAAKLHRTVPRDDGVDETDTEWSAAANGSSKTSRVRSPSTKPTAPRSAGNSTRRSNPQGEGDAGHMRTGKGRGSGDVGTPLRAFPAPQEPI